MVNLKEIKLKSWQVSYLQDFVARWDEAMDLKTLQTLEEFIITELVAEYNEFLRDCKLPALSADDLLSTAGWRATA